MDQQPEQPRESGLHHFWSELRRRKVMRVATAYAVTGWIIIQVASATFSDFGIPAWAFRFVVLMVGLGLPLALILAWAFELTPDGIRATRAVQADDKAVAARPEQLRKRNWMAYGLGALLPTLIFGSMALYFYIRTPAPSQPAEVALIAAPGPATEDPDKSIAVLPLENLSPDPDNAFFAAGVHEDILTNLSKIKALRVISRTSTASYKATTKNLMEIGKELGVRYLVEGSVRRAGDRVRVTVQLINAQTDDHLWAENYDRTLEDIFAIQSAIAKEIAGQLEAVISPEETIRINRQPTENLLAYDYFLKARELITTAQSRGDEKIALLEQAVGLDPEYAEAWAQLAIERIWWWAINKNRRDDELLAKAHVALENARRLGSDLAIYYMALASFAAYEDADATLRLEYYLKAASLDPNSEQANFHVAMNYYLLGQYEEAVLYMKRALKTAPDSIRTINMLSYFYSYLGMWNEARDHLASNTAILTASSRNNLVLREDFLEHLITGKREALITSIRQLPGFESSEDMQLQVALLERDYSTAIPLLTRDDSRVFLMNPQYGLEFRSRPLIAALIFWKIGDSERLNQVLAELKQHLEETAFVADAINHRQQYRYHRNLSFVHALEGNSIGFNESMQQAREARDRSLASSYYFGGDYDMLMEAVAFILNGDFYAALNNLEANPGALPPHILRQQLDLWFIFDSLRGDPRFEALVAD